jgi:hypothetical protein
MNGSSQLAKYEVIKMKHHQVNEKKLEKKEKKVSTRSACIVQ